MKKRKGRRDLEKNPTYLGMIGNRRGHMPICGLKIYIGRLKSIESMVEKMTAVWLIILTILVCAAVPGVLIWLSSSSAPARMIIWLETVGGLPKYEVLG